MGSGSDEAKRREVKKMADEFPATVAAIMTRDGCTRLVALQKAVVEPSGIEPLTS